MPIPVTVLLGIGLMSFCWVRLVCASVTPGSASDQLRHISNEPAIRVFPNYTSSIGPDIVVTLAGQPRHREVIIVPANGTPWWLAHMRKGRTGLAEL